MPNTRDVVHEATICPRCSGETKRHCDESRYCTWRKCKNVKGCGVVITALRAFDGQGNDVPLAS